MKKLMIVCQENIHHAQKFQKQADNQSVKFWSYVFGDKVWLNSKYMKTKHNLRLKAKFFGLFQMLHPIGEQAYKLQIAQK